MSKYCQNPECSNLNYNALNKYCCYTCSLSGNAVKKRQKPINKKSEKRISEEIIYNSERIKFLQLPENRICPITKEPTTDIHHKKGRLGSLFLDTRYWIALSRKGHRYVEENPEWAKENGYSLNRLSND